MGRLRPTDTFPTQPPHRPTDTPSTVLDLVPFCSGAGRFLCASPNAWRSLSEAERARYDLASASEAARALERAAFEQPELLSRLYSAFVAADAAGQLQRVAPERLLPGLLAALGAPCGPTAADGVPAFARLCVLKERAPVLAARDAPRLQEPPPLSPRSSRDEHYVAVSIQSPSGEPLMDVECEIRLANGSLARVRTDSMGIASVHPVPAGECTIRLIANDAGSWTSRGAAQTIVARAAARVHVVRQGEALSRICLRYGIGKWKRVWEDAANAALRKKRKSPHVLRPGDQLAVPGIEIAEIERAVDATHPIVLHQEREHEVRLRLHDGRRTGLDGLTYELRFEYQDKEVARPGAAVTDKSGRLLERLPVGVERVELHFKKPKLMFVLAVGDLDPAQDADSSAPVARGAHTRLGGLGYACAVHTDVDADVVAQFQREELGRDEPSGQLDAETCNKLEALYGA